MFGFRSLVSALRDGRQIPRIPTANIWLSVFGMFVLRLRSLNALEEELRRKGRWESWAGERKPSADTVGRVFSGLFLPDLRDLLASLNHDAWRSKSIHLRPRELYRVVAVDGKELWSSTARCCSECLSRLKEVKGEVVVEYYHRVVMAQWVGVTPPGILDIERVLPGEGEVVAATRLFKRLLERYGRLIDVVTADALYLEGPFLKEVLGARKHFVVIMKQEARNLYQDADTLRSLVAPHVIEAGPVTSRLWDIPDLTSFPTLGHSVRVVWAEERTHTVKIQGGVSHKVIEDKTWVWVTDLPSTVPATRIQQWGHDRWDLEDRGFNELSNLWNMDHCFVHNPNAIEALLLTLAAAFLVSYLFYERNLKPEARRHMTRLALGRRFLEDFVLLQGATAWPHFQPSG